MRYGWTAGLLAALFGLAITSNASAVTLGQADTFETETTESWEGGERPGITMSSNTATGGPTGAGDAYLQVTTTAFRVVTRNEAQWTGDYLAAGINAIELDLNAFAYTAVPSVHVPTPPTDLQLRLILWGPGGMFTSSDIASPTAGSGWQHVSFSVRPEDLVQVGTTGTGVAGDSLANVTKLMLRHDANPATVQGNHPPSATATIGIDNITAVPEPATALMFATGLLGWLGYRRR